MALTNLCSALAASEDPEDVERAAAKLEGLPERFKGLKRLSQERVKLAWSTGQTLARVVHVSELRSWAKIRHLTRARDLIDGSVSGLERLRLPLDAAAARVDLANVQAQLDPCDVLDTLEGIAAKGEQDGKRFDLSEVKAAAIDAAKGSFSREGIRQIWEALRALRAATVDAGAAPPVMSYAAP